MNTLRSPELRRIATLVTLAATGATALAGCGGFSASERFARCLPSETAGRQPVDLSAKLEYDPDNISQLKRSVRLSPKVLVETAGRIHPDPEHPDENLLSGVVDTAHNKNTWDSGGSSGNHTGLSGEADTVNNPGDILCETTPFGDPNAKTRRVYYDEDGIHLLARVEAALDNIPADKLYQ